VLFALLFLLAAPPASFDETFRAGLIALQKNDLPAALKSLTSAASLAPANGRVQVALAQAYWKSGDRVKAQESAGRAEKLAAGDPVLRDTLVTYYSTTYFEQVQPLLQQQKFAEALATLEEARRHVGSGVAQIELALGVSYYGLRRFDEAAEAFLRTTDLAPEQDQPYLFLGRILDQIPGRWADATVRFARYEAAHPQSSVGYLLHARGLDAQSLEPETAKALLEKSLELDDSSAPAHFELGTVLDRSQQFEAAVRQFERAVALDPTDAATHYRLARDYDRIGKHEAAEAERRRHTELVKAQEPLR
jgi:tetratricopeptide (TPR) repeat protein